MLEKMYAAFLRLVKVIIAITFAMLIVIVFGNVVGRLLFHTGFAWGDEASRFLFVWDTFLASILVNDTYGQMGLDYLVQRLSGRKSTSVKIIGTSFVIIILAVLTVGSVEVVMANWKWESSALQIRYGYVYGMIPVSCFVMLMQSVVRLKHCVKEYRAGGKGAVKES